ncbi:hypothetical protein BC828DRAFT_379676 [Blastocladiella britannica]|nr:hypothetical protein BC828DRAFT_379676 [Blastocladiella britannica]
MDPWIRPALPSLLLAMPLELLAAIASLLTSPADLAHMRTACRLLHASLTPVADRVRVVPFRSIHGLARRLAAAARRPHIPARPWRRFEEIISDHDHLQGEESFSGPPNTSVTTLVFKRLEQRHPAADLHSCLDSSACILATVVSRFCVAFPAVSTVRIEVEETDCSDWLHPVIQMLLALMNRHGAIRSLILHGSTLPVSLCPDTGLARLDTGGAQHVALYSVNLHCVGPALLSSLVSNRIGTASLHSLVLQSKRLTTDQFAALLQAGPALQHLRIDARLDVNRTWDHAADSSPRLLRFRTLELNLLCRSRHLTMWAQQVKRWVDHVEFADQYAIGWPMPMIKHYFNRVTVPIPARVHTVTVHGWNLFDLGVLQPATALQDLHSIRIAHCIFAPFSASLSLGSVAPNLKHVSICSDRTDVCADNLIDFEDFVLQVCMLPSLIALDLHLGMAVRKPLVRGIVALATRAPLRELTLHIPACIVNAGVPKALAGAMQIEMLRRTVVAAEMGTNTRPVPLRLCITPWMAMQAADLGMYALCRVVQIGCRDVRRSIDQPCTCCCSSGSQKPWTSARPLCHQRFAWEDRLWQLPRSSGHQVGGENDTPNISPVGSDDDGGGDESMDSSDSDGLAVDDDGGDGEDEDNDPGFPFFLFHPTP